jgi:hypothetical protein
LHSGVAADIFFQLQLGLQLIFFQLHVGLRIKKIVLQVGPQDLFLKCCRVEPQQIVFPVPSELEVGCDWHFFQNYTIDVNWKTIHIV